MIDILCACSNMVTMSLMTTIGNEDIVNYNKKYKYNLLIVLMIVATWMRLVGFLFVMESFSKLIMTIIEMLKSATTFIFICGFYLSVMSTIAICLFQESSITYSNFLYAIRTMFDAMLGMYQYRIEKQYENSHTIFLVLHIYVANIFLLNYLVAILSTVYEQMLEKGDFRFKCYRYSYIERYKIAFKDDNGYSELVVHPPPFNMGLIFILPAVFKK